MEQKRLEEKDVYIRLNADDRVDRNSQNRKNFGHVVFNKIYHELELDRFFNNKRRHENFKFNTNSIIKVLIFARLSILVLKGQLLKSRTYSLIRLILHWMTYTIA